MTRPLPGVRTRLAAVAASIPPGSRVADVGSDHGRLPRALVRAGRASWCVATERGAGPADRLRAAVDGSPEADRIEVRRGDGLAPLCPGDAIDVLVLAGMGGPAMLRILDRERLAALGPRRLVLQPQSAWGRLRAGLDAAGLGVERERLVLDRGRFYTVLEAAPGIPPAEPPAGFSPAEWYEIGPCWARGGETLARAYWSRRRERAARRLARARGAGRAAALAEARLAGRALEVFETLDAPARIRRCR